MYGEFTKGLIKDCGYTVSGEIKPLDDLLIKSLILLNIISSNDELLEYSELQEWTRGGAETYIAIGRIVVKTQEKGIIEKKFIAKAIVVFGSRPSDVADMWLDRRKKLEQYGISVPDLFTYHKGAIYEEFVPHIEWKLFQENQSQREWGIRELAKIVYILDILGFHPLNIRHLSKIFLAMMGIYNIIT